MKRILILLAFLLLMMMFGCSSDRFERPTTEARGNEYEEKLIRIDASLLSADNDGHELSFDMEHSEILDLLTSLSEYHQEKKGVMNGLSGFDSQLPDTNTYSSVITAGYVGTGAGYVNVGFSSANVLRIQVHGSGNDFAFNGLRAGYSERDDVVSKYKYVCLAPNLPERIYYNELFFVQRDDGVYLVEPNIIIEESTFSNGTEYIEGEYNVDWMSHYYLNERLYRLFWRVDYSEERGSKDGKIDFMALLYVGLQNKIPPKQGKVKNDEPETKELSETKELYEKVQSIITNLGFLESMSVSNTSESVLLTIKSDEVFASGAASVVSEMADLVRALSDIIVQQVQDGSSIQIFVTVHTDNRPINTAQYPSNVSLSLARATAFVEAILNANTGIDPSIFIVEGEGDQHPVASNDTIEGMSQNRRIEMLFVIN